MAAQCRKPVLDFLHQRTDLERNAGAAMHLKFLVVLWALVFTCVLWAPMGSENSREQFGLFNYAETEIVFRERTEPDWSRVPPGADCGALAYIPIAEKQTRYKAPQLAATIALTAFMWVVGALVWRRGSVSLEAS
jgi:hypothetical protein